MIGALIVAGILFYAVLYSGVTDLAGSPVSIGEALGVPGAKTRRGGTSAQQTKAGGAIRRGGSSVGQGIAGAGQTPGA